jgi:hypothetical protein
VFSWKFKARFVRPVLNIILLQESAENCEKSIQWEYYRAK